MRDIREYLFVIPGACPPKGSRVPVGRGQATRESSKRVRPWMAAARQALQDGFGQPWARFEGPVYVAPLFVFKRPKVTEFPFPTAPNIGDLDKLIRCLLDALTQARVIEDDRFVVSLEQARKIWGERDQTIVNVGRVLTGLADVSTFGEEPGSSFLPTGPGWAESIGALSETCDSATCNGGTPHYHNSDGSWYCWCLRLSCSGCRPVTSNPYA